MGKCLWLAVLALLLVASGCGAVPQPSPKPTNTPQSGIQGRVLAAGGPLSAATSSPRPYPASEIKVIDSTGTVIATVVPHSDGTFKLDVPPGTYTLDPRPTAGNPGMTRQTVSVHPGRYTHVIVYATML
jgi:hypothetical protein